MCRSLGLGCSRPTQILCDYHTLYVPSFAVSYWDRFWAWQPTLKVLPRVHLGSPENDTDENNVWNLVLCLCCRLQTGQEAWWCRFVHDFRCDESPQQVGPARSSEASGGQWVKHHCFTRPRHTLVSWSGGCAGGSVECGVLGTQRVVLLLHCALTNGSVQESDASRKRSRSLRCHMS